MSGIFEELRRRNVFRVAAAYAVVGWLIIQLAIALETTLNLPGWFDTLSTVLVLIGFPLALLFAWAFELTQDGLKRSERVDTKDSITNQTGRRLDMVIIAGLIVVAGLIAFQISTRDRSPEALPIASDTRALSIAVLPFDDFSRSLSQGFWWVQNYAS